jgi:hypothetical protein
MKEFILKGIWSNTEEFDELIRVLLHTNHDLIVKILQPDLIDMTDLSRCDPKKPFIEKYSFGHYNSKDELEGVGLESESSSSLSSVYPMAKEPRGFCLLINNYYTVGTYKEMQRFRNIFYQLHFKIIMKKNLETKEILEEIMRLNQSEEIKSHDAFVFMIIAKGDNKNGIFGFDDKSIPILSIIELMDDDKCHSLLNKPRMFFFNCLKTGILVSIIHK